MTTVDNSTTTGTDIFAAINAQNAAASSSTTSSSTGSTQTLGQDAFLQLLITQLKNQNPLNPQDNTEFVAQLAQFSSLEGIQNLNTSLTSLASSLQSSQALQASSLVGRSVEVQTDTTYLDSGGTIIGSIDLPNSSPYLQMSIYDSSGQLVLQKDLGSQEAGSIPFAWDGTASDGSTVPAGTYTFDVEAKDATTGKSTKMTTYLSGNVNSVTVGTDQSVMLNVNGVGQVALSDVKDIL